MTPKRYSILLSNEVSDFIKKQRKIHGLTQRGLALKAGVGLRFVREMEQGKVSLRMDKVNQVLQLFGKTLGPVDCRPETVLTNVT